MQKEVVVKITDLSRGGAGVSRDEEGRVIFVPYTAPGDQVRVRILETQKRYSQGEVVEILEPSALRQKPRCPAFGVCGGCQWQHLPYSLQWDTKVQGLLQALDRVQVSRPLELDSIPAHQTWEYRNRVQLRGEGSQIGFLKAGSNQRVSVDRCDLARSEINEAWEAVRKEGVQFRKPFKVEVEVTQEGEIRTTWNARHSSTGFRQVHDEQNKKLKSWVYEILKNKEWVLDLYGGSGNLSLNLQESVREIHCVDFTAPRLQPVGISSHFHFHRMEVLAWLRSHSQEKQSFFGKIEGAAILDPPREGLSQNFLEIAQILELLGVRQIIAIGCDVDSWARDLSRWVKRGWEFKRLLAIDLFPQTYHLESVGVLVLK